MHDQPQLPHHAEAQLEALLKDFRSHHALRRRQRRTAGSAAILAAVLIGTCAAWLHLADDAAQRSHPNAPIPNAPILVEGQDHDHEQITPQPLTALPHHTSRANVRIVRLTDAEPSTVRAIHTTVTTTRIPASESSIIRIDDDEALRMLKATGRSTGIIRIGDRVLLADEIDRSGTRDDESPTSHHETHPSNPLPPPFQQQPSAPHRT